jgi:hypothetical protein
MTALVNSRAAVRLLGSASLRGDAVGRRGASSHADLFWAKCSTQDVAPISPIRHLRPADAGECTSRRGVPIPNRYTSRAKFCFCKNNKRMIIIDGTSDSRVLPEYSPRPACYGGGHCATAETPTQHAAYACGV